jgi:probable addiction module antidote protein
MTVAVRKFDPAEYLRDDEDIACFLNEALMSDDAEDVAAALDIVARSVGMSVIAQKSGVSREALFATTTDKVNLTVALDVLNALRSEATPKNDLLKPA